MGVQTKRPSLLEVNEKDDKKVSALKLSQLGNIEVDSSTIGAESQAAQANLAETQSYRDQMLSLLKTEMNTTTIKPDSSKQNVEQIQHNNGPV